MSNLDDIFDLPEGEKQEEVNNSQSEYKKPRKKAEMSDDKKLAMLERLKAGREKRAENLKAKKEPKEEIVNKEAVSNSKEANKEVISQKKDTVLKKTDNKQNKTDSYEDEKLSFIKMMAGKSKPIEKQSQIIRPKKKVYTELKEDQKPEVITKPIAAPVTAPIVATPKPIAAPVVVAAPVVKVPVVIRTFKKPVWG